MTVRQIARLLLVVVLAVPVVAASPALACNEHARGLSWHDNCWIGIGYDTSSNMATEMQRIVKGAGWYSGAIDGIIGPVTDGAIKNYQNAHGLTADGIVGPATWNALWVDTAYCQFGNPYDYLRAKGYENCTSLGSIRHASSSTFYFYVKKLNNTWHASMNRSGPS